jgi:hypothetical protein
MQAAFCKDIVTVRLLNRRIAPYKHNKCYAYLSTDTGKKTPAACSGTSSISRFNPHHPELATLATCSTSAWGAFQASRAPVTNANIIASPFIQQKSNSISRAASWLCREKNLWRYTHLTTRSRRPSLHAWILATGRSHRHRVGFLTGLSHLSRHHPHRSNLIRRTIRLAHFGSLLPQTTERKAARHSLPIIRLRCGPSISS